MKNLPLFKPIIKGTLNFLNYYRSSKSKHKNFFKYQIITTLDEFKKTNLIQLSFLDNPGDIITPLKIQTIKNLPDIVAHMHPVDINTINDLYYLSRDKVVKLQIDSDSVTAFKKNGQYRIYNVSDAFDPESSNSTRLSYIMGYMQAEKIIKNSYNIIDEKYCIVKDNITTLEILDKLTNKIFLKNPLDILFSDEYKNFSKKDISRIGYICGQISQI